MSKKRKIISIGIFAVIFAGIILFYNGVVANADAAIIRLSGKTRYETAVQTSVNGWNNGSDTVVIVSGGDYPDALSAAPLAKKFNAPILLSGAEGLNGEVMNEVTRLKAKNAYIVGGIGAVPENVENQLKSKGVTITRLAGKNRYETAIKVAQVVGTSKGIVLASGTGFADALSIAPIAAVEGMPILLTNANEISSVNKEFIKANNISITYVVGGIGAVTDSNMKNYPNPVRIAGENRYATNVKILDYFDAKINYDKLYLASGANFPDGLVGAPIAALSSSPVILISEAESNYMQILKRLEGVNSKQLYIFGGTSIISDNVVSKVIDAIKDEFKVIGIE